MYKYVKSIWANSIERNNKRLLSDLHLLQTGGRKAKRHGKQNAGKSPVQTDALHWWCHTPVTKSMIRRKQQIKHIIAYCLHSHLQTSWTVELSILLKYKQGNYTFPSINMINIYFTMSTSCQVHKQEFISRPYKYPTESAAKHSSDWQSY